MRATRSTTPCVDDRPPSGLSAAAPAVGGRVTDTPDGPAPGRHRLIAALADVPQPLNQFLFCTALVALYAGLSLAAGTLRPGSTLVAAGLLEWLAPAGVWGSAALLLGVLAIWHVRCRRPWRLRPSVLGLMIVESWLTALPLLAIPHLGLLRADAATTPRSASGAADRAAARPVASPRARQTADLLGPAIHEELLFRMLVAGGLYLLARRGLGVAPAPAAATGAVIAALLFSAAHLEPLGAEMFTWGRLLQRGLAGLYLGLLFFTRGIGIAIGAHAVSNLLASQW